jgi:hypothetical protein
MRIALASLAIVTMMTYFGSAAGARGYRMASHSFSYHAYSYATHRYAYKDQYGRRYFFNNGAHGGQCRTSCAGNARSGNAGSHRRYNQ